MSTSPSGTLAPGRRPLPANLSHSQRRALEQFLGGQISAGALSAKLAQAEPGTLTAEPDWSPARGAHRADRGHRVQPAPTPLLPVVLLSAVFLATLCAFTVASASTSSEPLRGPAIAKPTRAGHHQRAARTSQIALIPASSPAGTSAPSGTHRARRAHHQATPPGPARGRGHGKAGPGGKPGGKPVAKPPAGPAPPSAPTASGTGGGPGSTPTGGATAGAGPTSGQSTQPASSGTSGSSSGTSTSGSSSGSSADTTTSQPASPTGSASSAS